MRNSSIRKVSIYPLKVSNPPNIRLTQIHTRLKKIETPSLLYLVNFDLFKINDRNGGLFDIDSIRPTSFSYVHVNQTSSIK